MATTYFPYDSGPGANVTEQQWWKMAKLWRTTGVIPFTTPMDKSGVNDFSVTPGTGLSVNVAKGTAWIKGHYFNSDATITKTLSPADPTNPRIDRIVVRNDWVANTITVEVLQGQPASSPSPPTLTQTEGTRWEMPLAQVYVAANATSINSSNITDEREPSVESGQTIAARITRASTYSVPNATETAVPFDTAIYDNCNIWNGGYKLTAPRTGYYLITICISWAGNATGTRYQRIRRNGTVYLAESQWQPGTATNTMTTTTVAKLNKGDYIEALVYQSSGAALTLQNFSGHDAYPEMTMTYLGE